MELKRTHISKYITHWELEVDFVLWSPKGSLVTVHIYRDNAFIDNILLANKKLWETVIAPELFKIKKNKNVIPLC